MWPKIEPTEFTTQQIFKLQPKFKAVANKEAKPVEYIQFRWVEAEIVANQALRFTVWEEVTTHKHRLHRLVCRNTYGWDHFSGVGVIWGLNAIFKKELTGTSAADLITRLFDHLNNANKLDWMEKYFPDHQAWLRGRAALELTSDV